MATTIDFSRYPLTGWYPGHMLKAGRQMQASLKLVDLVVELLDARIPGSSRNPIFDQLFRGRPTFILLNKADLASPRVSREWTASLRKEGKKVVFLDARDTRQTLELVPAWRRAALAERSKGRTALNRPLRIMIVGIPNVGKSTLINRLVASKRAAVGPKPGVTRHNQWIRLKGDVELLDTPGVLWPRIDSKEHELKLALCGSIREETVGPELLADYAWAQLSRQDQRDVAWDTYGLEKCPETPDAFLEAIGRRRGLLRAGGAVDPAQSAAILIKEIRDGRLGRLSFDPSPA